MTLIECVVAGVIVLILAGAYYVYQKNGSFLPSAPSGDDSSSDSSGEGAGGSNSEATGIEKSSTGGGAGSTGIESEGGGGGSKTASGELFRTYTASVSALISKVEIAHGTGSAGETGTKTSSGAEPSSTGGSSTGGGGGGGGKVTAFFENCESKSCSRLCCSKLNRFERLIGIGQDPATTNFDGLYAAFWFCAVPQEGGSIDTLESTAGQAKVSSSKPSRQDLAADCDQSFPTGFRRGSSKSRN